MYHRTNMAKRAALATVAASVGCGAFAFSLDRSVCSRLTDPHVPPPPLPVLGQSFDGQSCEQVPVEDLKNLLVTDAPNIASFAEAVALRGAGQWYKPTDHMGCDRLPLSDFLSSVNVISACYFDDSGRPDSAQTFNGTSATFVVNWNGTVPCSPENAEKLKDKTGNPDLPFTLEFETSVNVPGDVSEVPTVATKFVGPESGVPPEVMEFDVSSKCPAGSTNVFLDDANVIEVADNAGQAYYVPSEHGAFLLYRRT